MNVELTKNVQKIITQVAIANNLNVSELLGKNRPKAIVSARQMCWKIINDIYGGRITLKELADLFSKTHATVIYSLRLFADLIKNEKELRVTYEKCLAVCRKIANQDPTDGKFNELKSVLETADKARKMPICKKSIKKALKIISTLS